MPGKTDRPPRMHRHLAGLMALWVLGASTHGAAGEFEDVVRPIVAAQCVDCHNARTAEGGIDLSRFTTSASLLNERALWKQVFDVVEAGQMPLRDSGYKLRAAEKQRVLGFVGSLQSLPDPSLGAVDPGKPVLRRLTRLEYNNTVRDLFQLDTDIFAFPERLPFADKAYFLNARDSLGQSLTTSMREYGQKSSLLLPQGGLPGDNRAEYGYANRGDALNMSPLLLEKYVETAAAIARSERLERESPVLAELLGIELKGPSEPASPSTQASRSPSTAASGLWAPNENVPAAAPENDIGRGAFVELLSDAFEQGSGGVFDVPKSLSNQTIAGKGGVISVSISGATLTVNPDVDLWCAGFATADETSGELLFTNKAKGEKSFELTFRLEDAGEDNGIEHLGVCVLARRSQRGTVRLTAIFSDGREVSRRAEIENANTFYSFSAPSGSSIRRLKIDGAQFSGDYVLLDDLAFVLRRETGRREQPSETPVAVVATPRKPVQPSGPPGPLGQRVERFLARAYRRPVAADELERALAQVTADRQGGMTEAESLKRLVQTTLSSPEFLFLAEPLDPLAPAVRPLKGHELASRLSYFLWSSTPDAELLEAAQRGELDSAEGIRRQVQRMLLDRSRSRELSESFATQWLRLDQLYSAKPDSTLFKAFYAGPQGKATLHAAMLTEALLLFETVLVEDRSVLDLIDSDFTWLNTSLASLYGLEEPFAKARAAAGDVVDTAAKNTGSRWYRVELPDRSRGGVMTMAAPLTLTSLPHRTSPIKRGAWLLETVFHRPPAEPKVAFVLEDQPTGQTDPSTLTVRQRFELHRRDPNCYSCHSRIDPPGFSLESFDAIGALRTHDGAHPVDASGVWNGVAFNGPAEFKAAVRLQEREVVRGFVEHLMSYALGRPIEHFDMPAVSKIVEDAEARGYRLSAVIEGIVSSYPFRNTRNLPGEAE